jgi:ABC-type dipeptide/oligopeptide/nickel transport system permease component
LIGVPIGLGLGILAALKKNKWQDQVINIFIILLISLPSVILALLIFLAIGKIFKNDSKKTAEDKDA